MPPTGPPHHPTIANTPAPSTWKPPSIPLFCSEVQLPRPPRITSRSLVHEFSALKSTLSAKAVIDAKRCPELTVPVNYDLDRASNKVLELAGDAVLRWMMIRIARRRYPELVSAGITALILPLLENHTFAQLSWYYEAFAPLHGLPQHARHQVEDQGIMANLFEAYAGALSANDQLEELEGWLEMLWVSGVYGDLDERASRWIVAEQEKLARVGVRDREKKRRKLAERTGTYSRA